MTKSLPGICGKPRKLTTLLKRSWQVWNCLSQPAVTVKLSPAATGSGIACQSSKTLAALPILVVFGDHRDTPTGIGSRPSWQLSFESCQALINRLKTAGGQARMLSPAESGIRGNSHMIMQDRNSAQIADLILRWIDERVSKPNAAK